MSDVTGKHVLLKDKDGNYLLPETIKTNVIAVDNMYVPTSDAVSKAITSAVSGIATSVSDVADVVKDCTSNLPTSTNIKSSGSGKIGYDNIKKFKIGNITFCTFRIYTDAGDGIRTAELPVSFTTVYSIQLTQIGGADNGDSYLVRYSPSENKISLRIYTDGKASFYALLIGVE